MKVAKKDTWSVKSIFFCAIILFSGCSVTEGTGALVCLTGVCQSNEARIAEIPWTPQKLEKKSCKDLSGEYGDSPKGSLFRILDFRSSSFGPNGLQLSFHESRFSGIPPAASATKSGGWATIADGTEVRSTQTTMVRTAERHLHLEAVDLSRAVRQEAVLSLDHGQIGCVDGATVIRTVSVFGGREGGLGTATAVEKKIQKFVDGSIRVDISTREWYFSNSRGLIGIDNNNRASGSTPRSGRYYLIFKGGN